ncbi:MAG: glycosyltransferase family 4 protein, partial [Crenarchaeota archaeon]|nr:glycosyltransferase family 4 protein [Thermoproteota archaeon]
MKVLVLSHMFPVSFNPVNGIFVLEQVNALAKAGVEVCVISPKAWAPWPIKHFSKKWKAYSEIPEQDEVDGIQVYYPKYLTFPKSLLFETSGKRMYKGIKDTIQNIHKE